MNWKWKVRDTGVWKSDRYLIVDSNGDIIAETASGLPQDKANARLIAAAPALLKACEQLAEVAQGSVEYSDWPELQKAVRKAHKAIDKATAPPHVG